MLAIDGRKRQTFDVDLGRALARVKGRGALAGFKGQRPLSLPAGSEIPSEAKRRMGGKTVQWTVLPWETLAGGLPMGARSASMTAQTNNSHQIPIYAQTIISKSHSNISNLFFNVPAEIEDI